MASALVSAALTLVLEVADEVALSTEAVDYLLRLEDPAARPFDSRLGVCFDHLCFVTVARSTCFFKLINYYHCVLTALYRVIIDFEVVFQQLLR